MQPNNIIKTFSLLCMATFASITSAYAGTCITNSANWCKHLSGCSYCKATNRCQPNVLTCAPKSKNLDTGLEEYLDENNSAHEAVYTPFDIVEAAYRGKFKAQDIPSYSVFCQNIKAHRISENDLFNAALSQNLVVESDRSTSFLSAIKSQSWTLCH